MLKTFGIALGSVIAIVGLMVVFQNCGPGAQPIVNSEGALVKRPVTATSTPEPTPAPLATDQFEISAAVAQTMNLGTDQTVVISITPKNGFTGGVDVKLDNTALTAKDPGNTVTTMIDQPHLSLGGSAASQVSLKITAPASAPTLNTTVDVTVTETSPLGNLKPTKLTVHVPVKVAAIFEVKLTGAAAAKEIWSIPAGTTVNLAQHPEGVTVRFVNASAATHRIHGTGPIAHQAANLAPNAVYEVKVMSQTKATATVYCHNSENAGQAARQIVFNATNAPPPPAPSGNPMAKYSYLSTAVFPKCVGCHTGAGSAAGIDLSSYAKIVGSAASVIAYNALSSGIYVETAGGSMPPKPSALLSATDIQNIRDWINDGASNN